MTVNCQQEIGNKTCEYLDHQAILASGKKMIDLKVLFSPGEEFFYVLVEFVNKCYLLGG